jgi:arylsulfatase A-like enzyme
LGHLANTIVVIVSDHGEEFLEHGRWGHLEVNLFDEILKVPFIVYLPGLPASQVVQRQVRLLDLMPTILDLCDCPTPDGLQGTSLVPLWTHNVARNETEISISERLRLDWHIVAIRTEAFKYIWDNQKRDQPRLFDLRADPSERENVSNQYPDLVRQFQAKVDAHLDFIAERRPIHQVAEPEHDNAVAQRLRDLGYIE